jgi:type IV fimbrial biogenesis protein FimT
MKSRDCGFTLTELMTALALAAVILAIGAPNFREFSRNNRMSGAANDFLAGIQLARTEAIKRQLLTGAVSICPSDNPTAGDAATCLAASTRQFNGWLVFADANANCERDAGELLLRAGDRIDQGNTSARFVKSNSDGVCIAFAPNGFTRTIAARPPARYVVFCDERGLNLQAGTQQSAARGLEITQTGRARITRDQAQITGWGVGCAT